MIIDFDKFNGKTQEKLEKMVSKTMIGYGKIRMDYEYQDNNRLVKCYTIYDFDKSSVHCFDESGLDRTFIIAKYDLFLKFFNDFFDKLFYNFEKITEVNILE